MTHQNTALADILDRNAAGTEPENVLAALADHGVFVPVNAQNSIAFMHIDGAPALPGYVSEECCAHLFPDAAAAVHCDAVRLIDISQQTGVNLMAVFSANGWAKIPLPLLAQTLARRGHRTQTAQTLKLTWSTHPLAITLRDAASRHLSEFPDVRTVWIAHAQWLETGNENLMVHIEIAADVSPDTDAAKRLIETLMSDHISPTPEDPIIAMRVLDPLREAPAIQEINAMGLDTIRLDPTTGQVHVISREYD